MFDSEAVAVTCWSRLQSLVHRKNALAAILVAALSGCATAMPSSIPDEATAIRVACAHSHVAACGYASASLKGEVWHVEAPPPPCPKEFSCVGGGSTLLISKRTGRVIKMIVYE